MSAPSAEQPRLHRVAETVGELEPLDAPAEAVAKAVRDTIPKGPVKDAISGTWLGHALHPLLTDVPIGSWTSSLLIDLLGGREGRRASQRLIGIGVLASVPTAVTGLNDWADTTPADDSVRRMGAVHALANVAALGLYTASWRARRDGRHGLGVTLGLAGAGALMAGGHLGGHLSYAKGVGVDQTVFAEPIEDWTDALDDAALTEGALASATVQGQAIVLARRGGRVFALADRCSHRAGSLSDGDIVDGCVQCPLHASRFRLEDGSVERGPAAYPQPVYETRVEGGRIQVRS